MEVLLLLEMRSPCPSRRRRPRREANDWHDLLDRVEIDLLPIADLQFLRADLVSAGGAPSPPTPASAGVG